MSAEHMRACMPLLIISLPMLAGCELLFPIHEVASLADGSIGAGDEGVYDGSAPADGAPIDKYREAVLADQPLAYWRLDDPPSSPRVKDETGHGYEGIVQGNVTLGVPGFMTGDACASFADQSTISFGDHFGFGGTLPFSLELWFKQSATTSWRPILAKGWYSRGSGGYGLLTNDAGAYSIVLVTYSPMGAVGMYNALLPPARGWTYFVLTFDGSNANLYVNGILLATEPVAQDLGAAPGAFSLGGVDQWMMATYYDGLIDEVAVYDHILSDTSVMSHYRLGLSP
jgi:hypothetical protein